MMIALEAFYIFLQIGVLSLTLFFWFVGEDDQRLAVLGLMILMISSAIGGGIF